MLYGDTDEITGICNLNFDYKSSWKVTGDTKVSNLEIYNVENITADEPVTITFDSTTTVVAGTYGNVTLEGPGVDQWPEIPEEPEELPEEEPSIVEETSEVQETPAPTPEAAPEATPEVQPEAQTGGLSTGGIVGIVIAVIVVIGTAVVLLKKRASKNDQ